MPLSLLSYASLIGIVSTLLLIAVLFFDGFTKFDMGGMMGMMGGGLGRPGMGQPTSRPDMSEAGMPPPMRQPSTRPEILAPQESPDPRPQAEEPSDIDKAGNFMKGLFGR